MAVYTLHVMNRDGGNLRPISAFEMFEWTPSVDSEGRILYARWDYVDRWNMPFMKLWSTMPDGTKVWVEVNKGHPASRTPVPDVRGFGRGQAIEELQALGFDVSARVAEPPSGTLGPNGEPYAGGQVWRTTPAAGELSPDGTVVFDYAAEFPGATTTTTP